MTRTSPKGDDQFVAANKGRRPFSANTVRFTSQKYNKIVEEISLSSCEALFAQLLHSLISKALRNLKLKNPCQRKIKECSPFKVLKLASKHAW